MYTNPTFIGGMKFYDHNFSVPLNYEDTTKNETINIFVREIVASDKLNQKLPYLLYLQGGPGRASPRPVMKSGWTARALEEYRLLLLDQRGTGSSSPISVDFLTSIGDAHKQAQYLTYFRADSIVEDCEYIRRVYFRNEKWTLLGQSFGGFVILSYLSKYPQNITGAIFTGGIAPILQTADVVYKKLSTRVIQANEKFYKLFPNDTEKVREIVEYLNENEVFLPFGTKLEVNLFLQIGIEFGRKNGFEFLHFLFEDVFEFSTSKKQIKLEFLCKIDHILNFDVYPLYAIIHECIYCDQTSSNWAAHNVIMSTEEFDWKKRLNTKESIYFTGEMVFPWMFDHYKQLKRVKEAANILAYKQDWNRLYDIESLTKCEVPCVAAVYYDDMYVDFDFSMEVVNILPNCRPYISNQYFHSALGDEGYALLSKLSKMLKEITSEKN